MGSSPGRWPGQFSDVSPPHAAGNFALHIFSSSPISHVQKIGKSPGDKPVDRIQYTDSIDSFQKSENGTKLE
jgi:hypothetical protein